MKLADAVTSHQLTGICEVDVDKVVKCLGKAGYVHEYDGRYRLINLYAGVKVNISENDAKAIIEKAGLIPIPHECFTLSTSYVRPK